MQQENRQAEPIKEYYIAYFDLLGYKDFLKYNPEKAEEFLQIIYGANCNTNAYIQAVNSSPIGSELGKLSIHKKVFSDNVLLCLETGTIQIEYPRFLAFLSIVADIQRGFLLQYGLFLRGGITIGKLSINDDFIFGQGLIDAVALEGIATYPRIIMGKTVRDFIFQLHFVRQEDLDRACDIERRAHSGEYISDEELEFCNSIKPTADVEKFYMQWRNILLSQADDNVIVLNYLYLPIASNMLGQEIVKPLLDFLQAYSPNDYQMLSKINTDQKRLLAQHKLHIIRNIEKYGRYNDIDVSSTDGNKEAEMREYILKKYLWVLRFHNKVCLAYHIPEGKIEFSIECDYRFMRMAVEIHEESLTEPNNNVVTKTDKRVRSFKLLECAKKCVQRWRPRLK